jgi:hypothetical protein
VDPDTGDYHITRHSAAVNAGVDASFIADVDWEARPFCADYDIGADAFTTRCDIYLPLTQRDLVVVLSNLAGAANGGWY